MKYTFLIAVLAAFVFFSCASTPTEPPAKQQQAAPVKQAAVPQNAELLEKSTDTPEWRAQQHIAVSGRHYFIGMASAADKEESRRKAEAASLSSVSRFIMVGVKSELKTYNEDVQGSGAGVVIDASRESGAQIRIRNYDTVSYSETWNRSGRLEYDTWVRLDLTDEVMKRLTIEAEGLTAWAVSGASCGVGRELDSFIKETAARKGWKVLPNALSAASEADIEKLYTDPKAAYILMIKLSCAEKNGGVAAAISLEHGSLTEHATLNTITAEGTGKGATKEESLQLAVTAAQQALQKKLFAYSGVGFSPQVPTVSLESSLSELDIDTLKLYEKAKKADDEGWLLPLKAAERWNELAAKEGNNPYKMLAAQRAELWNNYDVKKKELAAKMDTEKKKLGEALALTVVSAEEKARFIREFTYLYAPFYGIDTVLEVLDGVKDKEAAKKLREAAYSPDIKTEWKMACDRGDAPACYFFGATAASKEGDALIKRACENGIGAACHHLAKKYKGDSAYGRAVEMAQQACRLGVSNSCFLGGMIYYSGASDVSADMGKAIDLFIKACDTGNQGGCAYMGWVYENGEKVTKDADKAKEYYLKACNLGHAKSCERAGN